MRGPAWPALAALLVTAAAGCTGGTRAATTPNDATPRAVASSGRKAPIASTSPSPAAVGDTLGLTGITKGEKLDVTLVKVVDPAGGRQFFSPSPGTRFVAVQFRLRNTGSAAFDDVPANGAKVVDTKGQGFDSTFAETTAGPDFPSSTTITPGGTALGFVVFEVPVGSKVAMVQYAMDSGLSTDVGQWKVP